MYIIYGAGLETELRSRDNYIYRLKEEMATLVKVKQELTDENEQLRSQLLLLMTVKEEGVIIKHLCV